MMFTFDDKNPKKVLAISKEFEGIDDRDAMMKTLTRVCKEYRIIPNNIGKIHYDVMTSPCGICTQIKHHKCKIRTLSCNHLFHDKCIKNWLIENDMRCFSCNSFNTSVN